MTKKIISIVISAYNEEGNINELYKQLLQNTKEKDCRYKYEFVFVNDGSTDKTLGKIKALQHLDSDVRIVNLKRNFGHEIAMTAGMDHALGDAVIFMDADLQHPPVYIPQMVELWTAGAEIVLSRRVDNLATGKIYNFCSAVFYKILNWLSDTKIPAKSPDFRLIDRRYVDFLKGFNEHDRLFRGLLNWIMPTDKVKVIEFIAPERFSGKSKYNFFKSFSLATDSIIQFSVRPLRLATYIGLFGALISLVMAVYVIIEYYIIQHRTPGYATIMVTLSFLGSVILIALGIIGEYIGKIHMEVKKRPLYMADYLIVPPSKLRKSDGDGVFKRKKEAE